MAEQPDLEQLVEEIKKLKVSDLLLSTFSTIAQLGYAKLDPESRDLEQARIAVEALKAVVGVLEGHVPAETIRDFNRVVANLQLAYASAATAPAAEGDRGSEPQAEGAGAAPRTGAGGSEPRPQGPRAEPQPDGTGSEPQAGDSGSEPQTPAEGDG